MMNQNARARTLAARRQDVQDAIAARDWDKARTMQRKASRAAKRTSAAFPMPHALRFMPSLVRTHVHGAPSTNSGLVTL